MLSSPRFKDTKTKAKITIKQHNIAFHLFITNIFIIKTSRLLTGLVYDCQPVPYELAHSFLLCNLTKNNTENLSYYQNCVSIVKTT